MGATWKMKNRKEIDAFFILTHTNARIFMYVRCFVWESIKQQRDENEANEKEKNQQRWTATEYEIIMTQIKKKQQQTKRRIFFLFYS